MALQEHGRPGLDSVIIRSSNGVIYTNHPSIGQQIMVFEPSGIMLYGRQGKVTGIKIENKLGWNRDGPNTKDIDKVFELADTLMYADRQYTLETPVLDYDRVSSQHTVNGVDILTEVLSMYMRKAESAAQPTPLAAPQAGTPLS